MASTATGKGLGLGLAVTKQTVTAFCGFVMSCRKEYQELECRPGDTTHGHILRVIEITSLQRSYTSMLEV